MRPATSHFQLGFFIHPQCLYHSYILPLFYPFKKSLTLIHFHVVLNPFNAMFSIDQMTVLYNPHSWYLVVTTVIHTVDYESFEAI